MRLLLAFHTTFSASAFVPDGTSGSLRCVVAPTISRCVALSSSVPSISEVAAPLAAQQIDFFDQQLDMCKQISIDNLDDLQLEHHDDGSDGKKKTRTRFKEHPRCTARFGEVLLHAKDWATSSEEHQNAVQNARSIVNYVDACRLSVNNSCLLREGLVADIVAALSSQSIREFRVRQIEDGSKDAAALDFTLEQADLEILGRLYYSAIRRSEQYLQEVGLSLDHGGFTALLALCRASSDSSSCRVSDYSSSLPSDPTAITLLSKDEAKLDAALSNHFNGITSPGCRFLFSWRHGIDQVNNVGRAKRLIVAFSSLGNGLVRHEFGGSLAKINNQLNAEGDDTFDVLFVADPSQSWYQKDSRGNFDGFKEYEQRILIASRPYGHISLVGDSMGGSGALLFSHLATESVVSFSPQINLDGDVHVSRYDMTPIIRDGYCRRLLCSVDDAVAARVKVYVHRGVEKDDVRHTDQLMCHFSGKVPAEHIKIIEHLDCHHHQIAVHLKEKGQLARVLQSNLIKEYK